MKKVNTVNAVKNILMIYLFSAPVFGSAFDKSPVIYASLFITVLIAGYMIFKEKMVVLDKCTALFAVASIVSFAFIGIFSDKGSQFTLASLFLLCTAAGAAASLYKRLSGSAVTEDRLCEVVFSLSTFYSVMAILHQVFIESSFLMCEMDFGKGSHDMSACIAALGVMCAVKLYPTRKNRAGFFVRLASAVYVFIMSKSLIGCLFASIIGFVYVLRKKRQRAEAFILLISSGVFGALTAVFGILGFVKNKQPFTGSIQGLVNIIGVGNGGYNAINSIVDNVYTGYPDTFNLLIESMGVLGIAFMGICIFGVLRVYMKTKTMADFAAMLLTVVLFVTNASALAFMLPILCMYYSLKEEGIALKANAAVGVVISLMGVFFLYLTAAYVPYSMGANARDMGEDEKSAEYNAVGAKMEVFNSEGWIKAYEASCDAMDGEKQLEYIEKAIKFNPKNYKYRVYKAESCAEMGEYEKALAIWEEIILRHDKEYLYPDYARAAADVMKNCNIGLEETERLYNKLDEYAKKAVDEDIILEVNNILAESQQYYVRAREGDVHGDMYMTEVGNESGNTEG